MRSTESPDWNFEGELRDYFFEVSTLRRNRYEPLSTLSEKSSGIRKLQGYNTQITQITLLASRYFYSLSYPIIQSPVNCWSGR